MIPQKTQTDNTSRGKAIEQNDESLQVRRTLEGDTNDEMSKVLETG